MLGHRLTSEIEIEAEAERVWAILTDFGAYPEWNPFVRAIEGALAPGARLAVLLQPSGTRAMAFRPTLQVVEAPRELRWLGRVLMPGIFDGEHRFVIEALGAGRLRFEQSERFSGILVPFMRRSLDRDARRGFAEMNAALKARAEGGAGTA